MGSRDHPRGLSPLGEARLLLAEAYFYFLRVNSPPVSGVPDDMVLVPNILTVNPAARPAGAGVLSPGISLSSSRRVSFSICRSTCTLTDVCWPSRLLSLLAIAISEEVLLDQLERMGSNKFQTPRGRSACYLSACSLYGHVVSLWPADLRRCAIRYALPSCCTANDVPAPRHSPINLT